MSSGTPACWWPAKPSTLPIFRNTCGRLSPSLRRRDPLACKAASRSTNRNAASSRKPSTARAATRCRPRGFWASPATSCATKSRSTICGSTPGALNSVIEAGMNNSSEVIVKDPEILGGLPVFRGTRVPFKNLLDYLEGGHTLDEFLEQFPSVTRGAAIAALEHAKELVIAQAQ